MRIRIASCWRKHAHSNCGEAIMVSKPIFPKRIPTELVNRRLRLPDTEALRLIRPDLSNLNAIDARWPARRAPDAENGHWRWLRIASKAHDVFALLDDAGEVQGLWTSGADGPRKAGHKQYYRLDYLEVNPVRQRSHLGLGLLICVAARARELGCQGIFLSALPSATGFWDKFGMRGHPHGWRVSNTLIPFVIEEKLETLARIFDEVCLPT